MTWASEGIGDRTSRVPAADVPGFHPPVQRRSRENLEQLTRAVGELLVEAGPAELSVRDLVARAGTSVGAFYSRFDDRDAALVYTSQLFWARSRRVWSDYLDASRWEGTPAAVVAPSVIRTFARMMLADGDRLRAFVRLSLSVPGEGVVRKIAEHDRFVAAAFAELLTSRPGEIRHESPHEAAEEGFRRVLGAVRDFVVFEGAPPRTPDRERRMILAVYRMYGRYVDVWPVPGSYGELLRLVRGSRAGSRTRAGFHTRAGSPTRAGSHTRGGAHTRAGSHPSAAPARASV